MPKSVGSFRGNDIFDYPGGALYILFISSIKTNRVVRVFVNSRSEGVFLLRNEYRGRDTARQKNAIAHNDE